MDLSLKKTSRSRSATRLIHSGYGNLNMFHCSHLALLRISLGSCLIAHGHFFLGNLELNALARLRTVEMFSAYLNGRAGTECLQHSSRRC